MSSAAGQHYRASAVIRHAWRTPRTLIWASLLATTAQAQPVPAATPVENATVAASATGASVELGRLFFTPERRREIDRQREFKTEEAPKAESAPSLTIDGVVTRSSGKRTVWINGAAHDDGAPAGDVAVATSPRNPGQVVVRPAGASPIPAKVGDTVDRATGESGGALGNGSIATRPSAAR